MESGTISNTALTVLSRLLDGMAYQGPALKTAANDDVFDAAPEDAPALRTWLTPEARDGLYDELHGFIEGQPDIISLCRSLKSYIDARMDCNMVAGITTPTDDVHYIVVRQLCDDLSRAITNTKPHTQIGSEPLSDAQKRDVSMLVAVKSYYKTSFEGINALYRLSKTCMTEHAESSKNLGDVIDHVASHTTPPEPYDVADLRREYAASFIRGRVLHQMFLGMLQPVPNAQEWPQEIPAHTFLMIDQCWATAQHFVRSHQPDLDAKGYHEQVIATVQPMLQRLYKSGTWRCEEYSDVAKGFSGLRSIAMLHEREAASEVTRV